MFFLVSDKRKMCFVKQFSSKTWHFPLSSSLSSDISSITFSFSIFFFFNELFIRNQVNECSCLPISFLFSWALVPAKILNSQNPVLWLALHQKIHQFYDLSFKPNPRKNIHFKPTLVLDLFNPQFQTKPTSKVSTFKPNLEPNQLW